MNGNDKYTDLYRKQTRLTFHRSLPIAISQVLLALLLAFQLRELIWDSLLKTWLGGMLLFQLVWFGIMVAHHRSDRNRRGDPLWMLSHSVVTVLIAAAWGLGAGLLLFPQGDTLAELLLVVVLTGVAASSLIIHTFSQGSGALFIWLVLAPVAVLSLIHISEPTRPY